MRKGLTLLELLVAMAVFGLLMGAALGVVVSSGRVEAGARSLGLLSDRATFLATVLLRDLYPVGYGLSSGVVLRVNPGVGGGEDEVVASYLCEAGMEERCPVGGAWTTAYKGASGNLLWAGCRGQGCALAYAEAEGGLEVFRLAYLANGVWTRGSLVVDLSASPPKVQVLALYFRLKGERRTGSTFFPGASVSFPAGLSLTTFGLSEGSQGDGFPRAERLVVVWTPNLAR